MLIHANKNLGLGSEPAHRSRTPEELEGSFLPGPNTLQPKLALRHGSNARRGSASFRMAQLHLLHARHFPRGPLAAKYHAEPT